MKKIIFLLLTFTLCSCQSQQEIEFKVGYLPNYIYTLSQTQTTENTVTYLASDEIIENLKTNGYSNPTITNSTSVLKSKSITGELYENQFPLNIEVLESSNKTLNKGMRMHGNQVNGVTKIDSISNTSMTDDKKKSLLASMESMMNQINYPEKNIKVGENFEQISTMNLPIADVTIEIEIKSIYTLEQVENGIGLFDLQQVYSIKSATKDYEMAIDGTGNGQIEYDIKKQFFTKYYSEMEMNVKAELEEIGIEVKTASITDQTTDITASR
jgi:hypothetical protein